MRMLKLVVFLLLIAGAGMVGFAYLGDLSPPRTEIRIPVDLDGS